MRPTREERRSGLAALATTTSLLQRVRNAHPTYGLYEAAEAQWWWSVPRPTDEFPQLFWFDDDGHPEAAVTVTDFGTTSSALYDSPIAVVTTMPDATPEWMAHVVARGLEHTAGQGIERIELEVDRADEAMRSLMFERGFEVAGDAIVECWIEATTRPEISPLAEPYRLASRADTIDLLPHHMADARRPNVEERLRQTSLYRPDLDLVVLDGDDVAAYGLFWYDPVSATGVVEPMRTEDGHQQRGLARHVLTAGIDRLADAGAQRISIGYEPDNPASGHLYRSVGFVPHQHTDLFAGPTTAPR